MLLLLLTREVVWVVGASCVCSGQRLVADNPAKVWVSLELRIAQVHDIGAIAVALDHASWLFALLFGMYEPVEGSVETDADLHPVFFANIAHVDAKLLLLAVVEICMFAGIGFGLFVGLFAGCDQRNLGRIETA